MSTLSVDTIQGKTTAGTVAMPAGHIVQVVSFDRVGSESASMSTIIALSANTFSDVMSKTITTKLANSKIAVSMDIVAYSGSNTQRVMTKVLRDSTVINGDEYAVYGSQSVMNNYVFSMIDSPSASAGTTLTYKLQAGIHSGAGNVGFGYADGSGGSNANITLMEISQ